MTIDGQPWFVAKDICEALGLKNCSQVVANACDAAQYRAVLKSSVGSSHVSWPNRGLTCVNEGGAYALVMASRKPEANAADHRVIF